MYTRNVWDVKSSTSVYLSTIRIRLLWHAACAVSHRRGKRYFRPDAEIRRGYRCGYRAVHIYLYMYTNRCGKYSFSGHRLNKSHRSCILCVQYKLEIDRRPSVNDTRCCRRASGRVCQLTHVSLLSTYTHTHTSTHKHIQSVCEYII